eukprot:scaffold7967_cov382-Pinguiococcus_pyrenoidosus.AAC.2
MSRVRSAVVFTVLCCCLARTSAFLAAGRRFRPKIRVSAFATDENLKAYSLAPELEEQLKSLDQIFTLSVTLLQNNNDLAPATQLLAEIRKFNANENVQKMKFLVLTQKDLRMYEEELAPIVESQKNEHMFTLAMRLLNSFRSLGMTYMDEDESVNYNSVACILNMSSYMKANLNKILL